VIWHSLLHWLGLDSAGGPAYLAWSGFGSDISEIGILGALAMMIRRHNCHVRRCLRIGRHHVEGTPYVVCQRHSPHGAPTHQDVLDAHEAATGDR